MSEGKVKKILEYLDSDINDRQGLGDEWDRIDSGIKEDIFYDWKVMITRILEEK